MFAKHQQTLGSLANHLIEVNQLFDGRGFVALSMNSSRYPDALFLPLYRTIEILLGQFTRVIFTFYLRFSAGF